MVVEDARLLEALPPCPVLAPCPVPPLPVAPGAGLAVLACDHREAGLRPLVQALPGAVVELDAAGMVLQWNPAAERLLGWSAAEVVGRRLPRLTGEVLDMDRLTARLRRLDPLPPVQLRCRRKDRRSVEVEVHAGAVRTAAGQVCGVVALLVDVTERSRLARQLEHQAAHDPLTGLPNRTLFAARLAASVAAAGGPTRTGVLLIDLDRFKEVNDTLGHAFGDQLLAHIGPRLLAGVLRGDDLIARQSGDEFAVLLPDLGSVEDAIATAHRISAALHTPFPVEGLTLDVEASIGVAVAPDHGQDPVALMRHADTAMYEAKELSAGVVAYRPDRAGAAPSRLALLGELRRALDAGEFVLHYQPKVALGSDRLHGVEALVRWAHPTRGLLSPAEFIPVAETTGLINRLTMVVLDLALAQTRAWTDAGHLVPVAVNLSARCLHDPALPSRVAAALLRHDVPADLLRLEITESMLMADPARALAILRELAAAGIRLSVDDFGTGYSSMSYLRQLPVDELKIDRSFVLDMTGHANDHVLVRTAVDLAHNLGLTVVAEGVEDAATLTALHGLNCDVAQGYHLARPMPAEQLTDWMTHRRQS